MQRFKEIFIHSWLRYVISLLYGILILVIYNCTRDWINLINYVDAFFIAGASLICIGGLSIVTNLGTFDVFTHMFARSKNGQPKPTLYDYVESKKNKRHKNRFNCMPYFVLGIVFVLVCVILQAFL